MAHEAVQALAFLALIVAPGTAVVGWLAPRLATAARISWGMPVGAVLLCAMHGVACAIGHPESTRWAAPAVGLASAFLLLRSLRGAPHGHGLGWPLVAAASCALASWLLVARHATPLDSLPAGGTGLDDGGYHAACAAQFKNFFPAPDPTAEGFRQQAHFLVHLLVGALSVATGEAPLDLLMRLVPLGVAATLGFQLAVPWGAFGRGGPGAAAPARAAVVGGNAAMLAAPVLGIRTTVADFPLPTPILLWKLPGLGLALTFLAPALSLADRRRAMEESGASAGGWLALSLITCIGMCVAKPVAPVVMLGGIAAAEALALVRRRRIEARTLAFGAVLGACFAGSALLTYDAEAYGYTSIEPQPLRSAMAAFHVEPAVGAKSMSMLAGALLLWMPLGWIAVVAAWRGARHETGTEVAVAAGAALTGIVLLLVLFTPMGAEFQFALAGKLLGDAAGAAMLASIAARSKRSHRAAVSVATAAVAATLLAPAATKASIDFRNRNRAAPENPPLTPDLVNAMRWLRDHSEPGETMVLSNQEGAKGSLSAVECIAVSERQAYLAYVRYSPGAYVAMWQGKEPPLQARMDEARALFRATPGAERRFLEGTRVRWAVLDRARGERFDENALRVRLGEPAFANARIALWRLGPAAGASSGPVEHLP